jgi:hypothetical protein
MTSGTVEFTATQYELGDNLNAYFSWTDAKWNFTAEAYAILSIYNPSGILKEQYVADKNKEGSVPLQYTSNALGIWRARLRIWNGSSWTDLSHYTTVVEPEEEPPPPPPPSPPPPPPDECPDFWEDPIGWTLCTITNGFSVFIEWFGTSFWTFIAYIQQWAAGFTLEFWQFLQDPISKIQTWMSGVFVAVGELTNQISTGISTWWKQGIIDVGIMITDATIGFQSWIDERFTGINDWWTDAQTVWGTFWTDAITGLQLWVADFTINVNNWYTANLQPIIDTINSGLTNAAAWIAGFPALIGQWWQDRVIEVGVWITDATTLANEWITGFPDLIGTWWNDRVIEIGVWLADRTNEFNLWVETVLPGIVEEMLKLPEWLTAPFQAIGAFAQAIIDMLAGTYAKDQNITDAETNVQSHRDRIKEIILEWE